MQRDSGEFPPGAPGEVTVAALGLLSVTLLTVGDSFAVIFLPACLLVWFALSFAFLLLLLLLGVGAAVCPSGLINAIQMHSN